MANRAGSTASSSEVIPAGHAALTAQEELGENAPNSSAGLAALSVAALGVVFGDIGTSPVCTFRECSNNRDRRAGPQSCAPAGLRRHHSLRPGPAPLAG